MGVTKGRRSLHKKNETCILSLRNSLGGGARHTEDMRRVLTLRQEGLCARGAWERHDGRTKGITCFVLPQRGGQ